MIKWCFLALIAAAVFGGSLGCTRYLEERTPAGTVPPPRSAQSEARKRSKPSPAAPEALPGAERNQPSGDSSLAPTREEIVQRFSAAYARQGHPRFAIWLNRELSDEVRDWRSEQRAVVAMESRQHAATSTRSAETKPVGEADDSKPAIQRTEEFKDATTQAAGAAYVEQTARTGERVRVEPEHWMWAFEEGFMRPFLDARANLVDRATILRLVAADQDRGNLQPTSAKPLEMEALRNCAEVYTEVLLARTGGPRGGLVTGKEVAGAFGGQGRAERLEFRAIAKETRTGRILGNVSSANWPARLPGGRSIVVTPQGYRFDEQLSPQQARELGARLAIDLMERLASIWEE